MGQYDIGEPVSSLKKIYKTCYNDSVRVLNKSIVYHLTDKMSFQRKRIHRTEGEMMNN